MLLAAVAARAFHVRLPTCLCRHRHRRHTCAHRRATHRPPTPWQSHRPRAPPCGAPAAAQEAWGARPREILVMNFSKGCGTWGRNGGGPHARANTSECRSRPPPMTIRESWAAQSPWRVGERGGAVATVCRGSSRRPGGSAERRGEGGADQPERVAVGRRPHDGRGRLMKSCRLEARLGRLGHLGNDCLPKSPWCRCRCPQPPAFAEEPQLLPSEAGSPVPTLRSRRGPRRKLKPRSVLHAPLHFFGCALSLPSWAPSHQASERHRPTEEDLGRVFDRCGFIYEALGQPSQETVPCHLRSKYQLNKKQSVKAYLEDTACIRNLGSDVWVCLSGRPVSSPGAEHLAPPHACY